MYLKLSMRALMSNSNVCSTRAGKRGLSFPTETTKKAIDLDIENVFHLLGGTENCDSIRLKVQKSHSYLVPRSAQGEGDEHVLHISILYL